MLTKSFKNIEHIHELHSIWYYHGKFTSVKWRHSNSSHSKDRKMFSYLNCVYVVLEHQY